MSKITIIACALWALSNGLATASETEIDRATLRAMGIGLMQPLSDDAGLAIRGKGTYAGVWGGSQANWAGQSSSNNYSAGASWLGKGSGAAGGSLSTAGKFQFNFSGYGRLGR